MQVDAIQSCGGQRTVDGSRFRSGGGILWNILKTHDPKAYKEIMTKGREFEVRSMAELVLSAFMCDMCDIRNGTSYKVLLRS